MTITWAFFSFAKIAPLLTHLSVFEKRILLLAVLAHIIAAWFSIGFHHPDEHFQIIEFANYKLGNTPLNKLAWEFPAHIRPGLQPMMAYGFMKLYYATGAQDPYALMFWLRLISGAAALFTAVVFHKAIAPQIKTAFMQRLHFILSLLGWGLVYVHVRFSSENWSAMSFAWALIMLWRGNKLHYFWFGLFMALSVTFRFQAIFMAVGAGIWMLFIARVRAKDILLTLLGFLLMFGLGLLCERWLYGVWNFSPYAYVHANIFQNKAAQYGVSPWWWYFREIVVEGLAPFSVIMLLSIPVMLIYKPRHILSWSMIVFVAAHVAVAHKEFRFLWPLIFFFPFFAVSTLSYLEEKFARFREHKRYRQAINIFRVGFWWANGIALLVMITKPANDLVALNQVLLKNLKKETVIVYSYEFNPYLNGDTLLGASFYANPLIRSYCIDSFMNNDTLTLRDKDVWVFSEFAQRKNEFIFNYAGPFFDSSRCSVIWQRLPAWTYKTNFNGWVDRSNPYTLYRVKH